MQYLLVLKPRHKRSKSRIADVSACNENSPEVNDKIIKPIEPAFNPSHEPAPEPEPATEPDSEPSPAPTLELIDFTAPAAEQKAIGLVKCRPEYPVIGTPAKCSLEFVTPEYPDENAGPNEEPGEIIFIESEQCLIIDWAIVNLLENMDMFGSEWDIPASKPPIDDDDFYPLFEKGIAPPDDSVQADAEPDDPFSFDSVLGNKFIEKPPKEMKSSARLNKHFIAGCAMAILGSLFLIYAILNIMGTGSIGYGLASVINVGSAVLGGISLFVGSFVAAFYQ